MNRYPYKPGDRGNHRETNEMMEFVRRESMRQPNSDAENSVLVKSHKMIEPYSVFGVGQDGANEKAFPQPVRIKDPINESSAPYYTNRSQALSDDSNWWVVAIGATPEEITLQGTVEPGDRAKPNDDGKAEKDDSGELLCVSDTVEGRASFVYSPMSPAVRALVKAPDEGIEGGSTETCDVISYSDGREVVDGENDTLEVKNWKTALRGETASHRFKVEQWGDEWHIYDEDFICPEDEGGP